MTKLEELTELLVSEIHSFEVAVKKLEEIRKSKIQLDLHNLQKLLLEHRQHVDQSLNQNQGNLLMIEKLNKEARGYLKKGWIIVALTLFLNLLSVAVVFYSILNNL